MGDNEGLWNITAVYLDESGTYHIHICQGDRKGGGGVIVDY